MKYEAEGAEEAAFYILFSRGIVLSGCSTDADEKMNWLSSFGSAIAVVGAARLLRVYRLTRDPDKAADYDASLTDERTAYVANKARLAALYICIYVQLAAALSAILIFRQTLVGQVLCALTCLQTLVYTGCFRGLQPEILKGNPMNALEIKDLSKSFGSFSLQNLTLTVPMGTALGLIGENGAGKSTTISLILGQLRRDSGEIRILGQDTDGDNVSVREDIGVVFDQSCFPDGLNARQVDKVERRISIKIGTAAHFMSISGALICRKRSNSKNIPADENEARACRGALAQSKAPAARRGDRRA